MFENCTLDITDSSPEGNEYRKTSNIRRTCRRCSNYVFILDLTFGFKGLSKDNRKTVRESFKFWDLVQLILETWQLLKCNAL